MGVAERFAVRQPSQAPRAGAWHGLNLLRDPLGQRLEQRLSLGDFVL
jgi:hypothetical protein